MHSTLHRRAPRIRWALGSLGVLLLAGALWLSAEGGPRNGPLVRPAPATTFETRHGIASTPSLTPSPTPEDERTEAPARAPSARLPAEGSRAEPAAAPASALPPRWLVAHVRRSSLLPAQGLVAFEAYGDPDDPNPESTGKVWLDSEGGLRIDLAEAWNGMRLRVVVNGETPLDRYFELEPRPGEHDLGDLVLPCGGTVVGQVRGLSHFREWSWNLLMRDPELPGFLARRSLPTRPLAEDGRLRIEHVPAGEGVLTLLHPLLGQVGEWTLEVREGETTFFETTYTGVDPEHGLLAHVLADRPPGSEELWLQRADGALLAPTDLDGYAAWFNDLEEGEYSLTLALAGSRPTRQDGLIPGTHTTIIDPLWAEEQERRKEEAAREAENARDRLERLGLTEGIRVKAGSGGTPPRIEIRPTRSE